MQGEPPEMISYIKRETQRKKKIKEVSESTLVCVVCVFVPYAFLRLEDT